MSFPYVIVDIDVTILSIVVSFVGPQKNHGLPILKYKRSVRHDQKHSPNSVENIDSYIIFPDR